MLVCPHCRGENQEDARFCTSCGRSLAPEEVSLVSRPPRREESELEIDVPPPRTPSPLPGILTLVGLLVVGIGVATWFALRPNPCAGKFSSERFPYCVAVPEGWQEGPLSVEGTTVDSFSPSTEGPRVVVFAQPAPEGFDTEAYTEDQRTQFETAGLFPTAPKPVELGGANGLVWELTKSDTATGSMVTERRITLVHEGMAWLILISGTQGDVKRSLPKFEQMLDTWAWK